MTDDHATFNEFTETAGEEGREEITGNYEVEYEKAEGIFCDGCGGGLHRLLFNALKGFQDFEAGAYGCEVIKAGRHVIPDLVERNWVGVEQLLHGEFTRNIFRREVGTQSLERRAEELVLVRALEGAEIVQNLQQRRLTTEGEAAISDRKMIPGPGSAYIIVLGEFHQILGARGVDHRVRLGNEENLGRNLLEEFTAGDESRIGCGGLKRVCGAGLECNADLLVWRIDTAYLLGPSCVARSVEE